MRYRFAVPVLAVLLGLTACEPAPGPAGRVIGKETAYRPATKTRDWTLTVRTVDGRTVRFEVSPGAYDACPRGSAYPACTHR
ncbi:hypothetical protein [Streptomyces gilvosporeus]|uniref:Uncharacterized protein n=1 Tax=Streptomyces gilvosporeus TaxID=553510 RepID=A0A1V0TUK0_9ACTN|nr:hypothetical protein [Streptomyces gilvosporeus]ARF56629.1 hypothetical protein B1H19_22860 [Streptomyces gilvosporeus]